MSIETWKAQFYPEEAAHYDSPYLTDLDAVRHSILKWEGLQPDNMSGHEVHWHGTQVISDGDTSFYIDGSTCALCQLHMESCRMCPLTKVRGVSCCTTLPSEGLFSPWKLRDTKPQVMLMWLKRAEEYVIAQSKVQFNEEI